MGDKRETTRARQEAASWFARLGRRAVSTDDLRAFRDWRGQPANQSAYAEMEQTWSLAGDLRHDPEIQAATAAALDRRAQRSFPLLAITPARLAFCVAALLLVGLAALLLSRGLFAPHYETGVGEQRLVVLEDGSRIRLNTDTGLRVRFSGARRAIELQRGQAFFDVAHDPDRPFVVQAGDTGVRALGTRFDVRRDQAKTAVTLLEGKVQVREPSRPEPWTLAPDQQLTIEAGLPAVRRAAEAAALASWTSGRLMFDETPLSAAIAEVNRYGRTKVVLDQPALGAAPVTGVFDVGDTEAFVAAVTTLFDLQAQAQGREVRLQAPEA